MAETAFQRQYRQEMIAAFEQGQTLLRATVTTETITKGNQATFLVAGSGGAQAVTRGVNGMIPTRGNDQTQLTATLTEWHDLPRETRFNIFASQGDQRSMLQKTSVEVINRKIDQDIITELNTGTVNTGATAVASLSFVMKAKTKLLNALVPWDNNIWSVVTPAFMAYLEQIAAYTSSDYVDVKPLAGAAAGSTAWEDKVKPRQWLGVNWVMHPSLPGNATSAEKCFMYHRSAIGHAMDTERMDVAVGYNEEQDYSYARASGFFGSKLLLNSGVIVMNHDGSAFA